MKNFQILHIQFPNQYLLTSTMMRVQEFYESPNPKFRGKYFTHEQYMDWYAQTNKGSMSYFTDWSGFNIPGETFIKWSMQQLIPSTKENKLGDLVFGNIDYMNPFYLVATYKGGKASVLDHEVMHALYYLKPDYKKAVNKLLAKYNLKSFYKVLASYGYTENVFKDETQAYILTGLTPELSKIKNLIQLEYELKDLAEKFSFINVTELVKTIKWK